jgi:hypothetical protein
MGTELLIGFVYRSSGWRIAKKSPFAPMSQARLQDLYGIRWFTDALRDFFEDNPPEFNDPNTELVITEHDRVTVYPKATQIINDALVTGISDIIHTPPPASLNTNRASSSTAGQRAAKIDTVLIQVKEPLAGEQTYGMDGEYHFTY